MQQSVDTLVVARDENVSSDLGLRIDAFKKVVTLSIAEVKEAKVKLLLAEDGTENIKLWKEDILNRLNSVLDYLNNTEEPVLSGSVKSVETIKSMAQAFKDWRDLKYVPLLGEVEDYLVLQKGKDVISTAKSRAVKIEKDITKLKKSNPKLAFELSVLLTKANKRIGEGMEVQDRAEQKFIADYVEPIVRTRKASTTIELGLVSTTVEISVYTPVTAATSSEATSTTGKEVLKTQSIKELVKASFQDVKDAYQVFIDMSNLVRELL